jgi:ferredoxin-NADP reductase/nitrite reductase/ring-hydroxylating ferredoxin subunit
MRAEDQWYPVARSGDLPTRHVFHGELQGIELALWRTDDGEVNAWENRCPHRSVRFSLGVNTGSMLQCQYHGWRYRSGDGRCVAVPASNNGAVPTACARPFAIAEAGGYVWVSITAAAHVRPAMPPFEALSTVLRSVVVHAAEAAVRRVLIEYAELDETLVRGTTRVVQRGGAIDVSWTGAQGLQTLRFSLQPAELGKTIIHASSERAMIGTEPATRWHNQRLNTLRRRVEGAVSISSAKPAERRYIPIAPAVLSDQVPKAAALHAATVTERRETADDIVALRLELRAGVRLAIEAGAHVDVHTPAGLVRQYSIVNAPGELSELVLGVKRETSSRGGSASMHDALRVGDRLTISAPRNHFKLSTATGACLIAGGIGITPLLAMAQAMAAKARSYRLHYFARSASHVAFRERLDRLDSVERHLGLGPLETRQTLMELLKALPEDHDVYICGPRALVDCAQEVARLTGIREARVHVELFANVVDTSLDEPFRVRIASSDIEFVVPAGVSVAALLQSKGLAVETSCEQGVCGTCRVSVVEGVPEHRDVYLSDQEKAECRSMMACVSRSRSDVLVLDVGVKA